MTDARKVLKEEKAGGVFSQSLVCLLLDSRIPEILSLLFLVIVLYYLQYQKAVKGILTEIVYFLLNLSKPKSHVYDAWYGAWHELGADTLLLVDSCSPLTGCKPSMS